MKNKSITFGLVLAALCVSGTHSSQGAAHEWPEFRGPTGQGISQATNLPIHWSATSNVVWRVPIPGNGWSSPVLSRGRLYLTTAVTVENSPDTSLRALCLSPEDGRIIWNVEVVRGSADSTKEIHKKNSLASPTPVVRDDRVYVHFGHMGTAALNLDGQILWRQTGIKYSPLHGNGGSPALVGDLLVFGCDGTADPFLVALDSKSGAERWRTPRLTLAKSKFSFSTPLVIEVDGARQIISPTSGFMAGYDPKDGREIWRSTYGQGYSVITRPVFAHGLLFVSSSYDRPSLYAVRPAGAKGDVTETHVAWSHAKGAPNTPSTVVVGDELYFVSDSGIATCLDAHTGRLHWSERLGGGFSASPVAVAGRIYFQNEEGVGFVVKAGTSYELLAKNDLGEPTLASFAVVDNTLFIRSKSRLWRMGQ